MFQPLKNHNNNRRIWLEGKTLTENGFIRGSRIAVHYASSSIVIRLESEGSNMVSGRSNGTPVIDLKSKKVRGSVDSDTVYITINQGIIVITEAV